jgi:hypothetical protein
MNKNTTADTELLATMDAMKKTYSQPGAAATAPGFQPSHPRVGGRKPGSQNRRTRQAIEISETLIFHPAAFLATIALAGMMPNPDGSTTPVTKDDRIRAATSLAPFLMPCLQATQVTGANDGPIEVATTDTLALILNNSEAVEAAQKLALLLCEAEADTKVFKA